jgi:hypothetical protein
VPGLDQLGNLPAVMVAAGVGMVSMRRQAAGNWTSSPVSHRTELAQLADVQADADPLAFVMSANLHHRHLSMKQRAMIAARMVNVENSSNQHAEKKRVGSPNELPIPISLDQAAAVMNVSKASVKRVKTAAKKGRRPRW